MTGTARNPSGTLVLGAAEQGLRTGVLSALQGTPFTVVGEAGSARELVAVVVAERPSLLLVDGALPGGALEAIAGVRREHQACRTVVLASTETSEAVLDAIRAGAHGFLPPSFDPAALARVLRAVQAGEAAIPRRLVTALVSELQRGEDLRRARFQHAHGPVSDREWQVLDLLADGRSTAEAARELGISPVTVRRHLSATAQRLGLRDRAALMAALEVAAGG